MSMSIEQAKRWRELMEALIELGFSAASRQSGIIEYDLLKKRVDDKWDEIIEKL